MVHLSVIIPVYNEADTLPYLLEQLSRQRGVILQVLVMDGGSLDDTRQVAATMGATVVTTPRGRGCQMNGALPHAQADTLLFLHSDSLLEHPHHLADALAFYRHNAARHTVPLAGRFAIRFRRGLPGGGLFYRYYEAKSGLDRRECINGDQGMLMSRSFFAELGGFDQRLPFLEDRLLAQRVDNWLVLPGTLSTSARRFEQEGALERQVLNGMLLAMAHAQVWAFLARAPGLYQPPHQGQRLVLAPFFALIHELNQGLPWLTVWQRWVQLGEFVTLAAWQVFFFLDVLGPHGWGWGTPWLTLYSRWLEPLTRWRVWRWPMAGVTWLGFFLLWGWFSRRDRRG